MEALNGMTLLETLEDESAEVENLDEYLLGPQNQQEKEMQNNDVEETKDAITSANNGSK